MIIYQPSQSALTNALKSQLNMTSQKMMFLQQSHEKAKRQLNDVRFQQNHLKSKKDDQIENHNKKVKKIYKHIEELEQLIRNNQINITLDELIWAFKNNNWNERITKYLHENSKQTSSKITLIQKIIYNDQVLIDCREHINMLEEDIRGLQQQSGSLVMEFEELDEVIHQWNGSAIESISKIYQIKKQLNEFRASYLNLSSERSSKEEQLYQLMIKVNQCQDSLILLRKEQIPIIQETDLQLKQTIQFWLSPDLVYQIFLDIFNDITEFNPKKIDEVFDIIFQIHDKVVSCCFSLLKKQLKFEERQQLFDSNYQHVIRLINQNSQWFKEIDIQDFECLLEVQKINNNQFMNYIEQKSQRFQAVLQKQIRIFSCTQEHTSLKAQQIELERQVHKLLYEQSMIQCNYQRLESQLQQMKIAGPILIMNTQSYQLEQILDRINNIEFIQKKNKQLIEFTYPQEIQIIESQMIETQNILQQDVEELIKLKSDPQLVYSQEIDQDETFLQMELEQLNQELKTLQMIFQKSQEDIDINLQQYNFEESSILNKIDTIQYAMNDYHKPIKENIPPLLELHSKRQSLDAVLVDNNDKSILKYSYHQDTTERSHSRSRSALGSNTSSSSLRNFLNFQSPTQLKKTKLTLINNQSTRNSQKYSINQSSQKIDDTIMLSPNKSFLSSKHQGVASKVFKVYKRTIQNTYQMKISETNNYIPKFVKYNEKMKCIEFYNANKMGNELGIKDSALNIKQITGITQQIVKGVVKQNFSFFGLFLLLQKNQKIEILFAKQDELISFLNILK